MKVNNEIDKELLELGIQLPGKEMPFEIPLGYFENADAEMVIKVKTLQFLVEMPNYVPFEIPKAYLENFEVKTPHFEVRNQPKLSFSRKWIAGIAASLVLCIGIYWGSPINAGNNIEQQLSAVTTEEAKTYLADNLTDFETDLIASSNVQIVTQIEFEELNSEDAKAYLESSTTLF
jgi:hypothetical protein